MDPQDSNANQPSGNRPPPPPPRMPQGAAGASPASQQPPPLTPTPQYAPPAPPAPPAPQGGYPGPEQQSPYQQQPPYPQQPVQPAQPTSPYGYPPQAPDQSLYGQQQPAYPYPQQGQYDQYGQYGQYPPAKSGPPMWIWFAGGGTLLAIIGAVVVLFLVLGGGGGGQGSPKSAALTYWNNIIGHKYADAQALLVPELRAQYTAAQLEEIFKTQEAQVKFTSADATGETITGDTASVPMVLKTNDGRTANLTPTLKKIDNKWFILTAGQPNIPAP